MLRRARTRLAGEEGFTIVELLVTLVIGSVVLWALAALFTTTVNATARIDDRVDTTQRARVALDRTLTVLNSQVCATDASPPVLAGSNAASVAFFADLAPRAGNQPVARLERLVFDASARTITEQRFAGTTPSSTMTSSNVLATDVIAPAGASGPFRFYAYTAGDAPETTRELVPDPASGLSAAHVASLVRVRVDLTTISRRTGVSDARRSVVGGDAYVGTIDAAHANLGSGCAL